MDTNRLVSSLCYFSIFFAGFIFPIIVYFIVDSQEVKAHAKKALLSHLVPLISILFIGYPFIASGGDPIVMLAEGFFFGIFVFGVINVVVVIWNIVKGVKVLINN